MMVLITRGRELLLARAPRFPPGMYSALAGFVEPGETIEDCIRREVREEVGLEVGDIRYFASQSWAFPHSLMIAYTAEYAGGELRPDETEIAEARWFAWDAVPELPPSISISRRLIEATVARLAIGSGARLLEWRSPFCCAIVLTPSNDASHVSRSWSSPSRSRALPALAQDEREVSEEVRKQYAAALQEAATLVQAASNTTRAQEKLAALLASGRASRGRASSRAWSKPSKAGPTPRWPCSAR